MIFEEVQPKHLDALQVYKDEFTALNAPIHGGHGLDERSPQDYYDYIQNHKQEETLAPGFVRARSYVLVNDSNKILGIINLRIDLNEYLLKFGGHIGYSVAPSERRKGYASLMLGEVIKVAKDFGIEKVLVTCNDNNPGSYKTIESQGGVLENKIMDSDNEVVRRYWIHT